MSSFLRGSKKVIIGLSVAGAGAAAAALFGSGLGDDGSSKLAKTVYADSGLLHQNALNQMDREYLYRSPPWDKNWDRRHFMTIKDKEEDTTYKSDDKKDKEPKIPRRVPSA